MLPKHTIDPRICQELRINPVEVEDASKLTAVNLHTIVQCQAKDEFCKETIILLENGGQRSARISLSDCHIDRTTFGNALKYRNKYWIPEGNKLRLRLI